MCSANCNQGRCCDCGDNVKPFKGVVYGLLLSIPVWIGIGLMLYSFFKE